MSMTPAAIKWICLAFAAAGAAAYALANHLTPDRALLALAIIAVGLTPGVLYFLRPPETRPAFPMMALTGLFYAVFFGLPAFFAHYLQSSVFGGIELYTLTFLDAVSREAQVMVLIGTAILFSVWAVAKRWLFSTMPRLSIPVLAAAEKGTPPLLWLAWGLALAHTAYGLLPFVRSLPSIDQFIQPAGYAAFTIFYLLKGASLKLKCHKLTYFLIFVPVWIGTLLASGFLTSLVFLVLLFLVLYIYAGHRLPWKTAAVAVTLFLLAYPHMYEFRQTYWTPNHENTSFVEKSVALGRMIVTRTLQGDFDAKRSHPGISRLVRRVSLILPLSLVVTTTPEPVPYWDGVTYRSLLVTWIPRFLWRGKPEERWGHEFGIRYGILAPDVRPAEHGNSINLPWITELYANFGRSGIIVGMALIGLFLAALERILNTPRSELPVQAIAAGALLPLFYQESNFTVMTGSLPLLLVCMWLYFALGQRIVDARLRSGQA